MNNNFEEVDSTHANTTRRVLEHEDNLMVNRLAWLVASQSFLFTAHAIVLNGAAPLAQRAVSAERQVLLLKLLPVLGLATCGLIYLGLLGGVRVSTTLRRRVRERYGRATGVEELIPGTRTTHALGLAAPVLLPPLFFATWSELLV